MPNRPTAAMRFVSRVQRLEALPRSGWLVSGVTTPESVAAHSYEVAVIAMWIADEVGGVDVERVLRMALLHDVGEALVTDIPTPTKRLIGEVAVHDAERRAAAAILSDAPSDWLQYVDAYEERATIEARIVKAADVIQMLAKALTYDRTRRGDVERFFRPRRDDYGIGFVREVLDQLQQMYDEKSWFVSDFD